MGNAFSDDDADREKSFLEKGFDLDAPDADQKINFGTAAPNWQPQHTIDADLRAADEEHARLEAIKTATSASGAATDAAIAAARSASRVDQGQEVATMANFPSPESLLDPSGQSQPLSAKHRRSSSVSSDGTHKRPHVTGVALPSQPQTAAQLQQQQAQNVAKKLSYLQLARLGYQELVNAIIRPPRADYKVCLGLYCFFAPPYTLQMKVLCYIALILFLLNVGDRWKR
jgi:hypothetical protein